MPALQGKIAVITGGSSGIGLATAKRFVKEGAYVFITGRRQAELDKAVAEIGSNVTGVQGDVSNLDDLDRLYKEVATKQRRQLCARWCAHGRQSSPAKESARTRSVPAPQRRRFLKVNLERTRTR